MRPAAGEGGVSVLDGRAARGVALLVFIGCAALLGWIHRDDLLPGGTGMTAAGDDPAAACIAERTEDVERMVNEDLIDQAQADLFVERAVGMCRDQAGEGAGPSLPGLPAQ